MSDAVVLQKISELEAEIRQLRVGNSYTNSPSWTDVREVDDKVKRIADDLMKVKGMLAAPTLQKSDVQAMIDAAVESHKRVMTSTLKHLFDDEGWRESITSDLAVTIREEIGASLGNASKAAGAAQNVARISAESAVLLLRSTSSHYARA